MWAYTGVSSCVHVLLPQLVWGSEGNFLESRFLPCDPQELNSRPQVWWQAPLPAEPTPHPILKQSLRYLSRCPPSPIAEHDLEFVFINFLLLLCL